ncbi:hypothetical protein Patl1_08975 [Pistacia atlantica]|uniref:Uncharacterized protein n=1 Tax=Pistacia atlantica TaxID=434234 RepID=A0ACC1AHP0_9ROSI|nr:hypothetical protein Patl1_08975 [Pistacia atlantica]
MPYIPIFVDKPIPDWPLDEKQLKEIFKKSDVNGDGRLTKEELKKAFEKLGSRNPGWRVHRAFRHADNNKDGSISLEELDELVKYVVGLGYRISDFEQQRFKSVSV